MIFTPVRLKERVTAAFRWFGLGSLLLAVTLLGSVSANGETAQPTWQSLFLVTGLIGSLCIFFGLLILAFNMHHLWRGGE
ncbi:MAG: hypothetical protein AAB647_00130 [Patescibacteria group bacterium]